MSDASRQQFKAVVLPNIDSAYRLARGLTGNATDAEDVVQDACLRAFRGIGSYAGGNARAWLLAITRNAAFTFLARKRPAEVLLTSNSDEAEAALNQTADTTPTIEADLIARADSAALDAALASLPQQFREILILREYNDLSYREIAEMTKLPMGTVMSRLARARALMLHALAPERSEKAAS